MEENAARLLKVAWMTFPIGILFTLAVCLIVFWFQKLTPSDAYAQAILIHGISRSSESFNYYTVLSDWMLLIDIKQQICSHEQFAWVCNLKFQDQIHESVIFISLLNGAVFYKELWLTI